MDDGRSGDILGGSTSSPALLSLFCLFSRVKNEFNLLQEAFCFCYEHLEFTDFAIFHIPSANPGKLLIIPCMIPKSVLVLLGWFKNGYCPTKRIRCITTLNIFMQGRIKGSCNLKLRITRLKQHQQQMFHHSFCDSSLLIDRNSHFEILRWLNLHFSVS